MKTVRGFNSWNNFDNPGESLYEKTSFTINPKEEYKLYPTWTDAELQQNDEIAFILRESINELLRRFK